jgi:hypothetical protein
VDTDMREESRTRWWSHRRFVIGLTVVLLFSAALRLYQIDGLSSDYDEGTYLMTAWLQARGFPLYTEVVAVQPPMLFQPAAWLFALWGPSSTAARCLEVAYTLLGIAAVAYAGKLLWRPATGLMAALFLSLERYYFVHSREFIGTVSSVAVGALAVLAGLWFQATGRRRWLLAAGALLSFSLLIKPLSILIGLLLLWMIIARRRSEMPAAGTDHRTLLSFPWREALIDCLYLGVAGLVLPLLCSVLYNGPAMLRILASVHSARLDLGLSRWEMTQMTDYARDNLPVLLLASLGIIQTIRRRNGLGVTVIIWLALNLVFFATARWQLHHLALLGLPLALLAAQPVGDLTNLACTRHLQPRPWSSLAPALLLAYYSVTLPAHLTAYFSMPPRGLDWSEDDERWAAVHLLQQVTTPGQFIVSDDQGLVFEARRTALPALVDPSYTVIKSGSLTEQMVVQLVDRQASALVFWSDRFMDSFSILPLWAPWAYAGSKDFGHDRIIYYDKQTPKIAHPLNLAFGGEIALAGYELSTDKSPGLTLYWQKLNAQAGDYKVSLRLLNAAGKVVAQRDYQPHIAIWPAGVLLPEKTALSPISALPPGEYSLVIGLYDPDKPDLLPVTGGPEQNGLAVLEVFTLGSR